MPSPFHPLRNSAAQNAFKKTAFQVAVRKARRAAAQRGRRLRIMFTDEARFDFVVRGHSTILMKAQVWRCPSSRESIVTLRSNSRNLEDRQGYTRTSLGLLWGGECAKV